MSTFWTAENFYSGAVVDMTNFESIFLRGSSGHSGVVVDKRLFWGEIVVHYNPGGLYKSHTWKSGENRKISLFSTTYQFLVSKYRLKNLV